MTHPVFRRQRRVTAEREFTAVAGQAINHVAGTLRRSVFNAFVATVLFGLLTCNAPAWADNPHAGVYMGTFSGASDSGQFGMFVRTNGTAVAIFYDGIDETGGVGGFIVNDNGSFSFTVPGSFDTASGQISGNSVTGSSCCAEPANIQGTKSSATGFLASSGGLFSGAISGTWSDQGFSGPLNGDWSAIVDATGKAMVYSPVDFFYQGAYQFSEESGGMLTVSTNGSVSGTLLDGVVISGSFNANNSTGSGAFSFSGGGESAQGNWSMSRLEPLPPVPVPNIKPEADAGPDQVVVDTNESGDARATLDASGSSDPDGNLVTREWFENGELLTTGNVRNVFLEVGTHTITLKVTDNDGATDQDTVKITVNALAVGEAIAVADITNDAVAEAALLRRGSVAVETRNGSNGGLISSSNYHGAGYAPVAIVSIPDVSGNNLPEIGALGATEAGQIKLRVADAATDIQIAKYSFFTSGYTAVDLVSLPDVSGNALADVALLVTQDSDDQIFVQVRDAATGIKVGSNIGFLDAGFTPKRLVVLPDLDNNGVVELGVFATRNSDGRGLVELREADGSGNFSRIWYLDSSFRPLDVVVGDDANNNGIVELAMLAERKSDGRIVVERRNASGAPATTRHWYFSAGWQAVAFTALADTNDADTLPEYAVLALRSDGKPAVEIRNAGLPKATFRRFFLDENFEVHSVIDFGDTNGNGIVNLGVVGVRTSDQRVQIELRDARGSANRKTIWFTP